MAKINGRVIYVYPSTVITSKSSGNSVTKRDFVIAAQRFDPDTGAPTIDETNTPMLTVVGEDRAAALDGVRPGDMVTVTYGLRGRRYRDSEGRERIITDINVTAVTPQRMAAPQPPSVSPAPATTAASPASDHTQGAPGESDGLPF